MQYFDDKSVVYLENDDFDDKGNLIVDTGGKPAAVLLQGIFCGYCTQMKPEYHKFAKELGDKVFMATIQIDGNPSEKELAKRLNTFVHDYKGVPVVIGYDKHGKFVKSYDGDRTAVALAE